MEIVRVPPFDVLFKAIGLSGTVHVDKSAPVTSSTSC